MTEPTEPTEPGEPASPDLDFEHASFDGPGLTTRICNVCGTPIGDVYYTHGATTICPRCQPTHAQKLGESSFMLALGYGSLAAAAGALVWYAIRAITEYELGIIAIAVGIAVGIAVRKGAGPSTSKIYRLLAVGLTYASIVSTYIPMIAAGMMEGVAKDSGAEHASTAEADGNDLPAPTTVPETTVSTNAAHNPPVLLAVITYAVAAGIALIIPFVLIGSGEIMGVIIIAIGLWEAWQRSGPRPEDQIAGPFQINTAA